MKPQLKNHVMSFEAVQAASILTAVGNIRPILRRVALAVVGTGAAATIVIGSSIASFAGVNTTVNTSNQAGYQVGNNAYQFRFVNAEITVPSSANCTNPQSLNNNLINSGVQLIDATGKSAAVGLECVNVFGLRYFAGWNLNYQGNTFPSLNLTSAVLPGHKVHLQL
jgi:hypothetical protein